MNITITLDTVKEIHKLPDGTEIQLVGQKRHEGVLIIAKKRADGLEVIDATGMSFNRGSLCWEVVDFLLQWYACYFEAYPSEALRIIEAEIADGK